MEEWGERGGRRFKANGIGREEERRGKWGKWEREGGRRAGESGGGRGPIIII